MYIYLIAHDRKEIKTHTYIGCVEDFLRRLDQHNGQISGGPRITRRAAGSWEPIIILKLSREQCALAKTIKNEWKQTSRGLESRIRKGFALAVKYQLHCSVKKNIPYEVPILSLLKDQWDQDVLKMNNEDWRKIIDDA